MTAQFIEEGYIPVYEFHVEKSLRQKYQIDESFFSTDGNIIFTDFRAVRLFVHQINAGLDPRLHIYPGEVNAAGLLEEIFHLVLREYEKQISPGVFTKAREYLEKAVGEDKVYDLLYDFQQKFPSTPVYKGDMSVAAYLKEETDGRSHMDTTLEELMMLFFANFNPANKKLKVLFDEKFLDQPETFRMIVDYMEDFFEEQPGFGPDGQDIFNLFKTPILSAPTDISKQIDFILGKWKTLLPEKILVQLLKGKDLLKEDVSFDTTAGDGPAPTAAPRYKDMGDVADGFTMGKSGYRYLEDAEKDYEEHEAFTPDVHWMPSVVMLAKNAYVWMDQLSKKYQREIKKLDQIPDEELDLLRRWNFTGLWLIGIWERSEASRRIKHIMGNTDAVASAYSLYDYEIAHDLGGEQAYNNLNERAKARGLRLASDMVPNHTGIYSKWVIENPEYFIQAEHPPFPGYRFSGENLSQHPDFEIRIEDGYFSKTDAAVVFQRVDKRNGEVRYLYHGNDGTVMPWNDTAQLDMIKHEVREAVIQKIFDVARKFSIIRFDAAMTLAKKHFSRLWYPRPGTGGDIPSRADYAMSQKEFDKLFPVEFWREVVDRMNAEMPETLLLAEAFWFMEGYFVRTLGMHRVYNSAFMHMLKNEENEKYRDLITNTLEFEPEILKRYVNFMSNPDEETAIRQFGTDDKYFGVCLLMNTLPGLPMWGHGQIEGYTEKYGMEYQRAYYNEEPHTWLVQKHEKEIFPIMQKRYLFSEVYNFNIFDFIDSYGNVNENVFAFTNHHGHERALVMYNNKYEQAQGRIHFSAPKLSGGAAGKEIQRVNLSQALELNNAEKVFYVFREHISGLEYIRKGKELTDNGLHWHLNGFEYRLFWNFREVYDESGAYEKLYWQTGGGGIVSVENALEEARLQPLHKAFEALFAEDIVNFLVNRVTEENRGASEKLGYTLIRSRFDELLKKISEYMPGLSMEVSSMCESFISCVKSVENTFNLIHSDEGELVDFLALNGYESTEDLLTIGSKSGYRENIILVLAWFALKTLEEQTGADKKTHAFSEKLRLQWPLEKVLMRTGMGSDAIKRDINLIYLLLQYQETLFDFSVLNVIDEREKMLAEERKKQMILKTKLAASMLDDEYLCNFIGVNVYQGVSYFSKESYEELLEWFFTVAVLKYFTLVDEPMSHREKKQIRLLIQENVRFLLSARELSGRAGYRLDRLKSLVEKKAATA